MSRKPDITYLEGDRIPSGFSREAVERVSRELLPILRLEPGGDLLPIVRALGGQVHYADASVMADGTVFVHGPDDFDIYVSQFTSPRRDRFTIAHELGHYFIHSDMGKRPIIANRAGSHRVEWEANWFAAELIMPSSAFKRDAQRMGVAALAAKYGVSQEAAKVRKSTLGIE